MRIVFFGTATFAVPSLEAVIGSPHSVAAVVSQPDRPSGRGLSPRPSPVSEVALRNCLLLLRPESCRDAAFVEQVRSLEPEVLVVAAYGQIMPQELLDTARYGGINVHASLLPKWRGAAPIQRAIEHGETETGVTIMQMDAGMDTGDILLAERVEIRPDETAGELTERLARLGADLLLKVLDSLPTWTERIPQDPTRATKAPKVRKEEGRVDWSLPAVTLYNRYRAFTPEPGVYTMSGDKVIKLRCINLDNATGTPGEILCIDNDGMVVACGEGALRISKVQPEGRRVMTARDFANGYGLTVGMQFS